MTETIFEVLIVTNENEIAMKLRLNNCGCQNKYNLCFEGNSEIYQTSVFHIL